MEKTFSGKKLIKDISANTLQVVITQFFGLLIFYFTSKYLSKNDFGEFNWSLAIVSTAISILSLGLDLVFIKRVATSKDVVTISGIHFFHTIAVTLLLLTVVSLIHLFLPSFTVAHPLVFLVFISLAISNMANSFKLCLNGLEAYNKLAILALLSNFFKFSGILILYITGGFCIINVIFVYASTALLEFFISYFLLNRVVAGIIKPILIVKEYKYFILESLPQLGVVLFDSALARIDWILLGIFSTALVTAEYSFAYRIFELSKLPLLIVSPIILTRFSKIFFNQNVISDNQKLSLQFFFKAELFIVMMIPVLLVTLWSPLIDALTDNKYGSVNKITFSILATCVPIHAIINFLWTLAFVTNELKKIMFITISASLLNILGNLVFIPIYDGKGAAIAFLVSTLFQLILYIYFLKNSAFKLDFKICFLAFLNAFLAILFSNWLFNNIIISSFFALTFYFILAFVTKQIKFNELQVLITK